MADSETPSDQLTGVVVDAMVAAGLFRADLKSLLAGKIASGKMSPDDWRIELDLAAEQAIKAGEP